VKLPRFRFSLRTLLLATLFAGSVMLCWHLRGAWAFKRFSLEAPILGLNNGYVSPTGRFLLVPIGTENTGDKYLESNVAVLDLDSLTTVDRFTRTKFQWSIKNDWLLSWREKACATLVEYPEKKELLKSERELRFSVTTRFIEDIGEKTIAIIDSSTQRKLYEVDTRNGTLFVADDRYLIQFDKRCRPNVRPYFQYSLHALNAETGEHIWTWAAPPDCWRAEIEEQNLDSISIRTRSLPENFNGTAIRLDLDDFNLLKNDVNPDMDNVWADFATHTISLETGREIKSYTGNDAKSGPCTTYSWKLLSPDKTLWLFNGDHGQIHITRAVPGHTEKIIEQMAFPPEELRPENAICTIKSSDLKGSPQYIISRNNFRVVAGLNDNALGIWTRRRQHFEWWGVYEQTEFWLAALLFGVFLWSVRRDSKAVR
jgi:hypothetical protein